MLKLIFFCFLKVEKSRDIVSGLLKRLFEYKILRVRINIFFMYNVDLQFLIVPYHDKLLGF